MSNEIFDTIQWNVYDDFNIDFERVTSIYVDVCKKITPYSIEHRSILLEFPNKEFVKKVSDFISKNNMSQPDAIIHKLTLDLKPKYFTINNKNMHLSSNVDLLMGEDDYAMCIDNQNGFMRVGGVFSHMSKYPETTLELFNKKQKMFLNNNFVGIRKLPANTAYDAIANIVIHATDLAKSQEWFARNLHAFIKNELNSRKR